MYLSIDTYVARLKDFFLRAGASRAASWLLLCAFFWIVAAASFSGFVGKWGLRDTIEKGVEEYGIEAMLDASAYKPYVYRQLAPIVSNFADNLVPEKVKVYVTGKLKPKEPFARTMSAANPKLQFRYVVIYYSCFFSLFLSLFILRKILLDFGIGSSPAILAPTSLVLAFPYLQTVGGYFYDSIELFFMSLAFLVAMRGKIFLLIMLALPATLNKETFIFFLPTLYPILRYRLSPKSALIGTLLAIFAAGLINVLLKITFFNAPGGAVELHYDNALYFYLKSFYRFNEITYGIIGPHRAFLGTIAVITIIVLRSWTLCLPTVRQHLLIAATIIFPLFVMFCQYGELRDLSLLFVGFVILIALALDRGNNPKTQVVVDETSQQNHGRFPPRQST